MDPQYKIVRMKDLAEKLELKEARSFQKSENYLEYAIKEINSRSRYYWYQYLFLIDVLYVVIVVKSSVESAYESHPSRLAEFTPSKISSNYPTPKDSDKVLKEKVEEIIIADSDNSNIRHKSKRTKLTWDH